MQGRVPAATPLRLQENDQASSEAETPCPLCSDPMRPWLTVPRRLAASGRAGNVQPVLVRPLRVWVRSPAPQRGRAVELLRYRVILHPQRSQGCVRRRPEGVPRSGALSPSRGVLTKGAPISGSLIQELLDGKPSRVCDLGCGAGGTTGGSADSGARCRWYRTGSGRSDHCP